MFNCDDYSSPTSSLYSAFYQLSGDEKLLLPFNRACAYQFTSDLTTSCYFRLSSISLTDLTILAPEGSWACCPWLKQRQWPTTCHRCSRSCSYVKKNKPEFLTLRWFGSVMNNHDLFIRVKKALVWFQPTYNTSFQPNQSHHKEHCLHHKIPRPK